MCRVFINTWCVFPGWTQYSLVVTHLVASVGVQSSSRAPGAAPGPVSPVLPVCKLGWHLDTKVVPLKAPNRVIATIRKSLWGISLYSLMCSGLQGYSTLPIICQPRQRRLPQTIFIPFLMLSIVSIMELGAFKAGSSHCRNEKTKLQRGELADWDPTVAKRGPKWLRFPDTQSGMPSPRLH